MPTRHNDALDAYLTALAQLRDSLYTVQPIIVPASMFDSLSILLGTVTEEPPEEATVESNEELDNFLNKFVQKEGY